MSLNISGVNSAAANPILAQATVPAPKAAAAPAATTTPAANVTLSKAVGGDQDHDGDSH